jgi:polyisoprenoid-binding protein YceI
MTSYDFETTPTQAIEDLTGDYSLDVAHTRIGFTARHAMVTSVRGAFEEFEGTAHLDAADPSKSSATVKIKVASISTGQEQRDAHLRGPDFFDAETFPELTFVSTSAEQVDDDTYRLTGDLTVKDVTKPISIDFTYNGSAKDPYGNLRAGFEGRTTLNRKDWGLTWNAALETGGFLVSDKIKLEFDVSAVKLTPTA